MSRRGKAVWRSIILAAAAWLAAGPIAAQELLPRPAPPAGAIVSAKGGEELQLPREPRWHPALVGQDLIGGDTLRTGEIGTLGIAFADQTTIRVGRRSTLVVNAISPGRGDTELTLSSGNVWARAARGGTGVTVRTPAASAAIRGTDWSLSVDGDRTSIIVLEGVVEFANPQGAVTLTQGEAATARIGERPTKIVIVRPNDREQMLFYLDLRALFRTLPATGLDGAARRAERARLAAIPPGTRRAEDWVAIAENGHGQDRHDVVTHAITEARKRPEVRRDSSLGARLDLVEALQAGTARRYAEAADLFARAARGTDGRQRATALCGAYAAGILAQPGRSLPQPRPGTPDETICAAYFTGFAQGLEPAAAMIGASEAAAPGHQLTALLSAQVSLLLNRRDAMRATVARMRANDPGGAETALASGYLRGELDSDLDGSVADFRRGLAAAPGDSALWNGLGLAESERDAPREAEQAFRQAIATDPHDALPYANLAILLLDQSRVEEAGALIEKSLSLDPSFGAAYTAKGRYFLQKGDDGRALEYFLAGNAADPASAQGLLGVAIAHYQRDDTLLAEQALGNADRLDPHDPLTAIVRTAVAVDGYDADGAVTSAREAVRRYRNRGGYFAALSANRTGGSYLGQAYRLLGLEEWGRFYTDRVADPFTATSYFDQAAARRNRPLFDRASLASLDGTELSDVAGSLAIQGLLLDPLAVSGRIGRIDLLRRPFVDAELGGTFIYRNGRAGWQQELSVQAFSNEPVPVAISLTASGVSTGGMQGGDDSRTASLFVGIAPSAIDRVLFWGTASSARPDLLTPSINLGDADSSRLRAYQLGGGWSHTFGYRHVLTGAMVASRADQSQSRRELEGILDPFFNLFPATLDTRQRRDIKVDAVTAAVGHTIGLGDFTLQSGVEFLSGRARGFSWLSQTLDIPDLGYVDTIETYDPVHSDFHATRGYANLMWKPSDRFQIEGGAMISRADITDGPARTRADPRIGVAVSPAEGHWLRAAYRRDSELPVGFTLAPIATAGLVPNALVTPLDTRKTTFALRWDAEWTSTFFTSLEYQRQRATALTVGIPDTVDSFDMSEARIDYLAASANLWLTGGFGAFATVGLTDTKANFLSARTDVPYVPDYFGRVGLTFVHPSRTRVSVVENVIGPRDDAPGGIRLPTTYTTDIIASYETPDRRFLFGLSVLNLFDADYDLVAGRTTLDAVPGSGRTIAGSVKVRF